MSHLKRKTNSWLQSSFETEELNDDSFLKKSKNCSRNDKSNSFNNSILNTSYKKKSNVSLSFLMSVCAPQKSSELAVSRQKQQEIFKWFREKINFGKPNILLISGPSGCGKTEALKVIAKENNYDIVEWITPVDQIMDDNSRMMRQGERFEDFLIRATRYSSVLSDCSRRLLLVKDLPNCYIEEKDDFSGLLKKYNEYGREPVVFINTETGNSRILTTLFSPNNRELFGIDLININAVTPTALKNVMKRVSSILNSKANQVMYVSQSTIDEVLSNTIGDVRSAILNLIFSSLKVSQKAKSECTVREETLGLLRGIGRVINPKRTVGNCWKFTHNPDDIASCFQSQSSTAIRFIHENYLCTMGMNMEGAAKAVDAISLADFLNSEWRDSKSPKLALSHCIRGVMIANNKPVSQWNPVRKPTTTDYNIQKRNHANAEFEWYERFISPKLKKKPVVEELSESIIEEIEW